MGSRRFAYEQRDRRCADRSAPMFTPAGRAFDVGVVSH